MKKALLLLTIVWIGLPAAAPAADKDRVIVATGKDKDGRRTYQGRVVSFTAKELLLEQASGRQTSIPADRVLEIRSSWTEPHTLGDRLAAERKYAAALEQYRQAISQEQRRWVRRRILGEIIRCYRALGEDHRACVEFINLHNSDPPPHFFPGIPLNWQGGQPSGDMSRLATQYISGNSPPARLLGASWLLSTRRAQAITALQELTNNPDRRIALLAEAQLWRANLVTADLDEIARWRRMLARMAPELRGGPYYLIGQALARNNRHQEAALALMRPPILHTRDHPLAADSLLAAAASLEKLGRSREARGLYRELLSHYSQTQAAAEAKDLYENK